MNEPLEKLIRGTLALEKPPELSPFFASKLVNKLESKGKGYRFSTFILAAYWCLFSFFIFSILTTTVWSGWWSIFILFLVPSSFLFVIFHNLFDQG